jgi:uncharacterized protein (UPF0297 family)
MKQKKSLVSVYQALKEKATIDKPDVGYILSGDPTYITNYKNARSIVLKDLREMSYWKKSLNFTWKFIIINLNND